MPLKPSHTIVICGNYGAGNLGDELILDGLLKLVQETFPQAHITVLSSNPHHTEKLHKVVSLPMLPAGLRSWMKGITTGAKSATMYALEHADLFILGGGGLFNDENVRAVPIWYIQAQAALKQKIPLWCCGQSIGPLRTALGRSLTQKVFSRADVIIVRDQASAALLHSWNIEGALVLPDPAFAAPLSPTLKTSGENMLDDTAPSPSVVVSLRPWKNNTKGLDTMAHFIQWLWQKHHLCTKLVPFQISPDDDLTILKRVEATIKDADKKAYVECIPYHSDYRKVLEVIQNAQAVVGMRLHSLIMSTLLHKPFVGLSYSSKVHNFMEDLGVSDYCLDWETLDFDNLTGTFDTMMKHYGVVEKHLAKKQQLWSRQTNAYKDLFKRQAEGLKNMRVF